MTDRGDLKVGSFYWVMPVFDVDFVPPGYEGLEWSEEQADASCNHWSNLEQPALFAGHDENGNEKWIYLGYEEDPGNYWPVKWIGDEIVRRLEGG